MAGLDAPPTDEPDGDELDVAVQGNPCKMAKCLYNEAGMCQLSPSAVTISDTGMCEAIELREEEGEGEVPPVPVAPASVVTSPPKPPVGGGGLASGAGGMATYNSGGKPAPKPSKKKGRRVPPPR